MRRLLALTILLLLAVPAHAGSPSILSVVAAGDQDLGLTLQTARFSIRYIDGNNNGRPDAAAPDEPLYLDLDDSGAVSYGDLRLTAFDTYAPGTVVDLTNRDVGRTLAQASSAWFAQGGGAWWLDVDGSGKVSVGDVGFAGAPAQVADGDPHIGQALARPGSFPTYTFGTTQPGARDVLRAFYVDLGGFATGGGRVSAGDLRVTPVGLAPDQAPTRADFEQVRQEQQQAAAQQQAVDKTAASSSPAAWRGLDWLVVGLTVLNLAGLLVIARRVNELRGPPRNPFK